MLLTTAHTACSGSSRHIVMCTSTPESERYRQWDRALQTLYCIAIERRNKPGRKVLVWMGFGWPARGPLERNDNAPLLGPADFQQHAFYFACGAFNAHTRGADGHLPGHSLG